MKKITLNDPLPPGLSTVVTVGNFDGVHRGHGRLIGRTAELARNRRAASAAVTFEPHTRSVIHPELSTELLTTFEEKCVIMQKMGVDYVFCVDFDDDFRGLSQEEFVEKILVGRLNAGAWVMGAGHHVGKKTAGEKKNLLLAGGRYHIDMFTETLETAGGASISSTRIRGLINEGRIAEAMDMLGHPYLIAAERVSGVKVATKKLGHPTLNFKRPAAGKVIPPAGVYAAEIEIRGNGVDVIGRNLDVSKNNKNRKLVGALYFGDCPTYAGREAHFEFHALRFDRGIREPAVGETAYLWLHRHIRPDIAFPSEDALREQIVLDVNEIKKYFSEEM